MSKYNPKLITGNDSNTSSSNQQKIILNKFRKNLIARVKSLRDDSIKHDLKFNIPEEQRTRKGLDRAELIILSQNEYRRIAGVRVIKEDGTSMWTPKVDKHFIDSWRKMLSSLDNNTVYTPEAFELIANK